MNTAPLRVGILGTGAVARLHAEALAPLAAAELVAVSDIDPGQAARFAATHGGVAFPDLERMLADADLDVLHICTPPGVHAEQTITAFAAGAHVVLEKPPALSLAELDTMRTAGERAGRELAIVFQQRTGSAAAAIKKLFDEGAFGRPLLALCQTLWHRGEAYYSAPWRGSWATEGGGTTLGHGIHQIDLLAYLLGDWREVSGTLWRLDRDIETEDASIATIAFAGGALASVVTSVLSPRETSYLRIDTERATIELEHLYGHDRSSWHITGLDGEAWSLPDDDVPSGHDALLAAVYESLAAGAPLPSVTENPSRSLEIVTAIYASARLGRGISHAELDATPELRGGLESPVTDVAGE